MMNQVFLVGRLVKNPEMTFMENGRSRTRFTVAVERSYRNEKGERATDFLNCVMWGKRGESFSTYMCKGALVGLSGSIHHNKQEKNGQVRYFTDIHCTNYYFIESKSVMQARRGKTHDVITNEILTQVDAPVEIIEEELPF